MPVIDTLAGSPSLVERVTVRAPSGGARLQMLCFDVHRSRCVDLTAQRAGAGPNPRVVRGVSFEVQDATGAPVTQNQMVSGAAGGLEAGPLIDIRLASAAPFVELTMVSGRGGESTVQAFNTDGTTAGSGSTVGVAGRPDTVRLPRAPALEVPQQPFGLSAAGDIVYVADPVNHVVRALDLRDAVPGCPCEAVVSGNGSVGGAAAGADPLSVELAGPYAVAAIPRPGGAPEVAVADTFSHRALRLVPPAAATPGPTSLVAAVIGSGRMGFAGDGGPAPTSDLNSPYGIVRDAGRDVTYVADTLNHRVRAVRGAGSLVTVAGDGIPGSGGDGGPATGARLNGPRGLAIDGRGRLLIADTGNNSVRRFDPGTGTITTVAGGGAQGFAGDGGPAALARLFTPSAVAVDGTDQGNLFIADTLNHRIRRVDGATGVITTVAGSGTAGFTGDGAAAAAAQLDSPFGVAVRANGEVVIADTANNRVRLVDASQRIRTVAGNGTPSYSGAVVPSVQAQLAGVSSIAVIATPAPAPIPVAPGGGVTTTSTTTPAGLGDLVGGLINGLGAAVGGLLAPPLQVAGPAPLPTPTPVLRTVFADPFNHVIREVDPQGQLRTLIGTGRPGGAAGDGAPATSTLNVPFGVAIDRAASPTGVYVADTFNNVVRRIDRATGRITTVAGDGTAGFGGDGGPANRARLSFPTAVTLDNAGNLYIADAYNARIRKVDTKGVITTIAGTGRLGFSGDSGPASRAELHFPYGVTADGATPANVYVADSFNHRIRRIDGLTGVITTIAGNGTPGRDGNGGAAVAASLNRPWSVAPGDGSPADLFVADTLNSRIQRVNGRSGTVATETGGANAGFRGDLGPALAAFVSDPRGVTPLPTGPLMVADSFSGRARRIGLPLTGVDPQPVSFDPGARERPVQVTNTGKVTLVIADTLIDGEHAADFRIAANGCKGRKLPPGASCAMRIAFSTAVKCPTATPCRRAQLNLSGNAADSIRRVPLLGSKIGLPATIETDSNPQIARGQPPDARPPQRNSVSPDQGVTIMVHDTATVRGAPGGPVPTGTVQFHVCGPIAPGSTLLGTEPGVLGGPAQKIYGPSPNACSQGGIRVGEAALNNGSATSPPFQVKGRSSPGGPTTDGYYCWRAEYLGDDNYNPSSHTDGIRECFDVKVVPAPPR